MTDKIYLIFNRGSLPSRSEDTTDVGKQDPSKMPARLLMRQVEKYLEGV